MTDYNHEMTHNEHRKTSGRILIPYQWKTAITGTIAEPGNRTVLVDGVEQQANVIHSVGEIDLPPGATLSETVTVESIHSLETGELILQSGNLLREHLVGVPMPMKVFRNTPRSEEVCFGLAYFGGTMYGTASYNEQTQILSVGTSNVCFNLSRHEFVRTSSLSNTGLQGSTR